MKANIHSQRSQTHWNRADSSTCTESSVPTLHGVGRPREEPTGLCSWGSSQGRALSCSCSIWQETPRLGRSEQSCLTLRPCVGHVAPRDPAEALLESIREAASSQSLHCASYSNHAAQTPACLSHRQWPSAEAILIRDERDGLTNHKLAKIS